MTLDQTRIAVLGAGSWGTALASHLASQGLATTLWAREPEVVDGIAKHHRNPLFLTGVDLPASLQVSGDLAAAAEADVIVSAIPVPRIRATLSGLAPLRDASIVVTVSKGIEPVTLSTPHQILVDLGVADERVVALSGPSFAREVAAHLPAAVVSAGVDPERTRRVQQLFSTDRMRVYASDDIVGVEIGGAMKNVIALAAGVSDGLELGDNARAFDAYRHAVELDPKNALAWMKMGMVKNSAGEPEAGVVYAEHAYRADPQRQPDVYATGFRWHSAVRRA